MGIVSGINRAALVAVLEGPLVDEVHRERPALAARLARLGEDGLVVVVVGPEVRKIENLRRPKYERAVDGQLGVVNRVVYLVKAEGAQDHVFRGSRSRSRSMRKEALPVHLARALYRPEYALPGEGLLGARGSMRDLNDPAPRNAAPLPRGVWPPRFRVGRVSAPQAAAGQ